MQIKLMVYNIKKSIYYDEQKMENFKSHADLICY